MKCMICNSKGKYFFSKRYTESPFRDFIRGIGVVDYCKCEKCGFVWSKTHNELDDKAWKDLNCSFHHYLENVGNYNKINQPPYVEQAMMLLILGVNKIIDLDDMLDYAAGYGSLKNILHKYSGVELFIFDKYINSYGSGLYVDESELRTYKTVINSAMFEHVLKRDDLDRVNNLVTSDGCLVIHTVVCENVPNDPNWFYLDPPVHTAFHTNKSMDILMEQWGYLSSIYCPKGKCWILLRDCFENIEGKINILNRELQSDWFYCKKGFVDYWKGF